MIMSSKRSSRAGWFLLKDVKGVLTTVSYIASLVDYLERGKDLSGTVPDRPHRLGTTESREISGDRQHYFAFSKGAYRYLGPQSLLLQVQLHEGGVNEPNQPRELEFPSHTATNTGVIAPELQRYLLRLFFDSIHQVYPILDPSLPWLSLDTVACMNPPPNQAFVLQMLYAIACHCDQVHSAALVPLASSAHARALRYIEKATAEPSISTLQIAVLLVLYTLFDPTSGNVSQQLGFAVRLAIDLAAADSDEQISTLSILHKVIYCLENHFCSVLVRPATLQEPSTPLTFSTGDPLEFLCTLYRVQARMRNGQLEDSIGDFLLSVNDEAVERLHPNILSTLWETRLMLEPSATAAVRLSAAYSDDRYIATFLTAHWVHKAAVVIIEAVPAAEGPLRSELMLAYGNLVGLLGKWSGRWNGANTFLESMQSRLKVGALRNIDVGSN